MGAVGVSAQIGQVAATAARAPKSQTTRGGRRFAERAMPRPSFPAYRTTEPEPFGGAASAGAPQPSSVMVSADSAGGVRFNRI